MFENNIDIIKQWGSSNMYCIRSKTKKNLSRFSKWRQLHKPRSSQKNIKNWKSPQAVNLHDARAFSLTCYHQKRSLSLSCWSRSRSHGTCIPFLESCSSWNASTWAIWLSISEISRSNLLHQHALLRTIAAVCRQLSPSQSVYVCNVSLSLSFFGLTCV